MADATGVDVTDDGVDVPAAAVPDGAGEAVTTGVLVCASCVGVHVGVLDAITPVGVGVPTSGVPVPNDAVGLIARVAVPTTVRVPCGVSAGGGDEVAPGVRLADGDRVAATVLVTAAVGVPCAVAVSDEAV